MEIKTIVPFKPDKRKTRKIDLYWLKKIKEQKFWKTKVFYICVSFLIGIFFTFVIINNIEKSVKSMPCFYVDYDRLIIKKLPKEVSCFAKRVHPIGLPKGADIFNQDISTSITKAYLRNPWVKTVKKVTKKYPNFIQVQLRLRKPIVSLFIKGKYYIVDREGIRLPGKYSSLKPISHLLLIVGENTGIPAVGKKWQDHSICEALKIANCLQSEKVHTFFPIQKIVIETNEYFEKNIVLLTTQERRIIWGENLLSKYPPVATIQRINALKELFLLSKTNIYFKEKEIADIRFGSIVIREYKKKKKRYRRGRRRRL